MRKHGDARITVFLTKLPGFFNSMPFFWASSCGDVAVPMILVLWDYMVITCLLAGLGAPLGYTVPTPIGSTTSKPEGTSHSPCSKIYPLFGLDFLATGQEARLGLTRWILDALFVYIRYLFGYLFIHMNIYIYILIFISDSVNSSFTKVPYISPARPASKASTAWSSNSSATPSWRSSEPLWRSETMWPGADGPWRAWAWDVPPWRAWLVNEKKNRLVNEKEKLVGWWLIIGDYTSQWLQGDWCPWLLGFVSTTANSCWRWNIHKYPQELAGWCET